MPPLARPVPFALAPRPKEVTHLQRRLDEEAGELPVLRPAVMPGGDGGRPQGASRYLVGNLTHRALADWNCLSMPSHELRPRLAAWASRSGLTERGAVEPAVDQVLDLLGNLRRSTLFGEIAGADERHTEIPFSLATPAGVLHGVIDLLFRDGAEAMAYLSFGRRHFVAEVYLQSRMSVSKYSMMPQVRPAFGSR